MNMPTASNTEMDSLTKPVPWFRSGPFVLIGSVTIIIYALLGNFSPRCRSVLDIFATPLVDSLGWVFLNVRTSPMSGELDPIYYRNLMGLCVLFSALYNLASAVYMIKTKSAAAVSCEEAHRRMVILKGVSSRKAWVLLHLGMYFVVGGIATLTSFAFFNSMFGWMGFLASKHDVLFILVICFGFILPSSISVALWSIVGQYVFFDFRKIIEVIAGKKEI
jgi:hypothetical protein